MRPAARMIQGRTAAAPLSDSRATATSKRWPRLREGVVHARSVSARPNGPAPCGQPQWPRVGRGRPEVGGRHEHRRESRFDHTPVAARRPPHEEEPLGPSGREASGVARTSSLESARARTRPIPGAPPRSIPDAAVGGMPETSVAGT